jgi:hypothetical protein
VWQTGVQPCGRQAFVEAAEEATGSVVFIVPDAAFTGDV